MLVKSERETKCKDWGAAYKKNRVLTKYIAKEQNQLYTQWTNDFC